jgi:chemotaxis response regulator CheB
MLTEEKLKRLVSLMVERKIQVLKEGKKFQAIRSLTIQAQQTAMKFEEDIVDALELKEPDELSDDEQQIYAQAMADMHSKMIEAVVHASEVVKNLSERQKEPETKKTGKSSSVAAGNTVEKDLPTL